MANPILEAVRLSDTIRVYNLDQAGVIVDTSPLINPSGTLIKAQNAVADPIGDKGVLRKRPGLKAINAVATTGSVLGGQGIPLDLGSAGPNFQNPFTDLVIPINETPDALANIDPTFDDNSFYFYWDWHFDFDELFDEFPSFDFQNRFDPPAFAFDVAVDKSTTASPNSRGSLLIPINFIEGTGTSDKELFLNETMTSHVTFASNLSLVIPNPGGLIIYPNEAIRNPSSPNAFQFNFNNGAVSITIVGHVSATLNNRVYFAAAPQNSSPTLAMYDGFSSNYVLNSLASTPSSSTPAQLITTVIAANTKIYFAAWSSGVTTSNTGVGRVYEFDTNLNTIRQLGSVFPTDQVPCSLTFAYDKLWAGTASNSSSCRVYSMRPDAVFQTLSPPEDWVLDNTFAAGECVVSDLATFQGQVYAAIGNRTLAGSARLMVRTTAGVWSASDTGTIDTSGGHLSYRGYIGLAVWPPENGNVTSPAPTLFATRNGCTEDGGTNMGIRRLSAGTWSTVATPAASGGAAELKNVYVLNASNTLIPTLMIAGGTQAWNTHDGVTWTDRSAQLTISGTLGVFPSVFVQV